MKYLIITLLLVSVSCHGQDFDTLIYVEKDKHETVVYSMQSEIDSLQFLLESCREFIGATGQIVMADTFEITLIDSRVRAHIIKRGHDVWYNFEDGFKRINADYFNYTRSTLLMDSTYAVGSLYVR